MRTLTPRAQLGSAPDPVDFRLGFDGRFALVKTRRAGDPMGGHLFIVRNKTADRLKVLYWGGHGRCLWCPRPGAGRYHFPDPAPGAAGVGLTAAPFAMTLDGIDRPRVRRFRRYTPATPG
jgi:transposase